MTQDLIHKTAIIHPHASIAQDVTIGPYCVVGANVVLEAGVKLHSHVVIEGKTVLGEKTEVFPFASIGHRTQALNFSGESSTVKIGAHCVLREYVTIQPGSEGDTDNTATTLGDHCLLMASAHVAHHCVLGNHVIMANNATLAGHVHVGDYVIIGGLSAVHQFVRIGRHAIIGGMSGVEKDVIPYGSIKGDRAFLAGLNIIGLKRRGVDRADIDQLRAAYRSLFATDGAEGTFADRLTQTRDQYAQYEHIAEVLDFIVSDTTRPLCMPRANG